MADIYSLKNVKYLNISRRIFNILRNVAIYFRHYKVKSEKITIFTTYLTNPFYQIIPKSPNHEEELDFIRFHDHSYF